MKNVFEQGAIEAQQGKDCVLATILSVEGSSPRDSGANLLVREDGSIVGTIGGGLFEARVLEMAERCFHDKRSQKYRFQFRGEDSNSSEMICGGEAEALLEYIDHKDPSQTAIITEVASTLSQRGAGLLITQIDLVDDGIGEIRKYFERKDSGIKLGDLINKEDILKRIPPPRLASGPLTFRMEEPPGVIYAQWIKNQGTVFVFGLGHVGECVCHLAKYAGFGVVGIDDRTEFADPEKIVEADQVHAVEFDSAFDLISVNEDSYIVIVTRGHAHDRTVLERALGSKARYIGMIGSRRKNKIIFDELLSKGFTKNDIEKVYAPIGLPIRGDTPQEIGFSIVSQMIDVRNSPG